MATNVRSTFPSALEGPNTMFIHLGSMAKYRLRDHNITTLQVFQPMSTPRSRLPWIILKGQRNSPFLHLVNGVPVPIIQKRTQSRGQILAYDNDFATCSRKPVEPTPINKESL